MSNEDDCESAYRAGWRTAGAAIAERIAERYSGAANVSTGSGYDDGMLDGFDIAEQIARDEVRGE